MVLRRRVLDAPRGQTAPARLSQNEDGTDKNNKKECYALPLSHCRPGGKGATHCQTISLLSAPPEQK